jgi:organic radical activating enzyme
MTTTETAFTPAASVPLQPLHHLDILWVQVAGTLCNLSCAHCFVTSGPAEHRHALMARGEVRARVAEALALGVREIYFTGGEPFVHPEMEAILADTLAVAPVTVLTNGTLLPGRRVEFLAELGRSSRYSLELRISLDGADAATHDAVRGEGTHARAIEGLRALSAAGLQPIVTVPQPDGEDPAAVVRRHLDALVAAGLPAVRLKLLPVFRLGREAARSGPYGAAETLALLPPGAFDPHRLQCGSCRAVGAGGVYVCPLLVDEPGGRMGATLAAASGPFALAHPACTTCWRTGMTCANG